MAVRHASLKQDGEVVEGLFPPIFGFTVSNRSTASEASSAKIVFTATVRLIAVCLAPAHDLMPPRGDFFRQLVIA